MNKTVLAMAIAGATAFSATVGAAQLPAGAHLSIDAGSNFAMGGGAYGTVPLVGETGIVIGASYGDTGTGSHGGAPAAGDRGGATQPWNFFYNTGYDFISSNGSGAITGDTTNGVDMSAWTVTWNGIPNIPMGGCSLGDPANNGGFSGCDQNQDGTDDLVNTGIATLTWDGTDGGAYTLTYTANVPVGDPSNFGGVQYDLVLTGVVTFPGSLAANNPPNAVDDSFNASVGATGVALAVLDNDSDTDQADALDKSSIDLDPSAAGQQTSSVATSQGGLVSVDMATGIVSYDAPPGGFSGTDTFAYTVSDFRGPLTSSSATVSVAVGNLAPVCNDDTGLIVLGVSTFVDVDILANDSDPNGNATIDPGSVTIVTDAANGITSIDAATGVVTYTPNPGFSGEDSFTYNVSDNDAPPLTCVDATVTITVSNQGQPLPDYLLINTGNITDVFTTPPPGGGSYFTMELDAGRFTHVPLAGFNHINRKIVQPAASPTPSTPANPNIDEPWSFFGSLGVHQTTSVPTQVSNENGVASLDFSGWNVSWNGIASIPMGEGQDNGVATIRCYTDLVAGTVGTCAAGDEYVLTYRAIVPPGDPSGFGGVNYALHLEGTLSDTPAAVLGCDNANAASGVTGVSVYESNDAGSLCADKSSGFVPGQAAASAGNTTGVGLTPADLGVVDPLLNPDDGTQCLGGCVDFVINNVTGDFVDIVVKLDAAITQGAIYRKLINGRWVTFDTSGADQIGSRPAEADGSCIDARGDYQVGLRDGAQCLKLRIYDGGNNDADGMKNGSVADPSGVLLPGSPNVPASYTDGGCSVSKTPVAIRDRADWLIVLAFIGLMALVIRKRSHR